MTHVRIGPDTVPPSGYFHFAVIARPKRQAVLRVREERAWTAYKIYKVRRFRGDTLRRGAFMAPAER